MRFNPSKTTLVNFIQTNPGVLYIEINSEKLISCINSAALNFFKVKQEGALGQCFSKLIQNVSQLRQFDFDQAAGDCITFRNYINNQDVVWNVGPGGSEKVHAVIIGTIAPLHNDVEHQFLQNVVNNVPHFIFWKDVKSTFLGCNRKFASVVNMGKPRNIMGLTDFDMPWSTEQSKKYIEDDASIVESGVARLGYEETQTQADGTERIHLVSKVPMRDDHDHIIGILGIYTDITELKLIEKKLADAKDAAEQSNRAKTQFIAAVSHELKTPLNGILCCTELLMKNGFEGNSFSLVNDIQEASKSLDSLVDDILDFSQLEAGKFRIKSSEFNLESFVRTAYKQSKYRSDNKNLKFSLYYDSAIPQCLVGDGLRIKQMLTNLLSNASKYTKHGSIELHVTSLETSLSSVNLEFKIIDTGIGIDESMLDHIFDRFAQINLNQHYFHDGVGLGLAIFKQICGAMGAKFGVESTLGEGSTFWFTLSLPIADIDARSEQGVLSDVQLSCNAESKILVIEDNLLNQKVMSQLLNELDCQYTVGGTGQSALEYMKSECYDLVFLDLGLPDMDGFEVAKLIREFNNTVPIVLLTAYSLNKADIDRSLISRLLLKPICLADLSSVLNELLHKA